MTAPRPSRKAIRATRRIALTLPDVDEQRLPGSLVVRRSVSLMLSLMGGVAAALVVAAFFIRLNVTVAADGALEPIRVWKVRATAGGAVREVVVRSGDTVQVGQVVARLDTFESSTAIGQLRAQIESARLALARDEASTPLNRNRAADDVVRAQARLLQARATLREQMLAFQIAGPVDSLLQAYRGGTHIVVDRAVADVWSATADVRVANTQVEREALSDFDLQRARSELRRLDAELRAARERQLRLITVAPARGLVLTDGLERLPGVVVREGDELLELADVHQWRAHLRVGEKDVHRVRRGDRVALEMPALVSLNRDRLWGTVELIAGEPSAVAVAPGGEAALGGASGGYRVLVALEQAPTDAYTIAALRRGYTVRGRIVTRSGRVAILIRDYFRERLRAARR